MAGNRKKQERAELHCTIWDIANDLLGSVDGWDVKQYVLGILFYRYISANIKAYINEGEREAVDIRALNAEIDRIVTHEDVLRKEISAIIAEIEQGTPVAGVAA